MGNTAPGVLTVASSAAGQGLSRPVGRVAAGFLVTIEFWARTDGLYLPVQYGLQDNFRLQGPAIREGALSTTWRRFGVAWRPSGPAPDARFYVWQLGGRAQIHIAQVRLRRGTDPATPLGLTLKGSVLPQLQSSFDRAERGFVQTRVDAFELAGEAFAETPVTGIGWQRFSEYSGKRLDVGPLATHNEYARVLAELGVPGGLALLAVLLSVGHAARHLPRSLLRTASVAGLASGAVGLIFVNGLVTPTATLPLAITAGVVVGGATWRQR